MKQIKNYSKLFLLLFTILFFGNAKGQVNGFAISDADPIAHNLGIPFSIGVQFNWALTSTTSATATIAYNNTLVAYDAAGTNGGLPACVSGITNNGSIITINLNNLANCQNIGSLAFNVKFKFLCPDSCAGVLKPTTFIGRLTDNLGTVQNSNATANGILDNTVQLSHSFYSYNVLTSEVTYLAYFINSGCFKIKNPVFNISLPAGSGTISSVISTASSNNFINITHSFTATSITPNTSAYEVSSFDLFYYTVKLPCNRPAGPLPPCSISLNGTNCGIVNSVIKGPVTIIYGFPYNTIAFSPTTNPSVSVIPSESNATYFEYEVLNSGNTPLNLRVRNVLPNIHLTSVTTFTTGNTQTGLIDSIQYFDCASVPTASFSLPDAGTNTNVPTNTKSYVHSIYNLLPSFGVRLRANYDANSSCNGAGFPPSSAYADSIFVSYNCVAPPVACISCVTDTSIQGPRDGPPFTGPPLVLMYNPLPIISCLPAPNIEGAKKVGDTLSFCYQFKNIGAAPLNAGVGVYGIQLPIGVVALPASATYTGFTTNPTVVAASNISFSLPTIPVGQNNIYGICFKAVVQSGAVGGTYTLNPTITGTSQFPNLITCRSTFSIGSFAALGVSKKVKGSLNSSFAISGEGAPNTLVNYEITLSNPGTVPVRKIVVIDRVPAIGNLTILGNPTSAAIANGFNMEMVALPSVPSYTASYTSTQNICTGWPATGTNCNAGVWGTTLANNGVKFTFDSTITIAPGDSLVFTFQTKIPSGTANNLVDSNKVGFIATPIGFPQINPVESNSAWIKVVAPVNPCDSNVRANFQLAVTPAASSYSILPVLYNTYPSAGTTHEWYILSSPNQIGGPYTPVYSIAATSFSFNAAQYNLYYTVIHKVKTNCGEACSAVKQYQTLGNKKAENNPIQISADCCLALQYWPNGAGSIPQAISANFEIGTTPLGGGQYTINVYPPANTSYSNNPSITHQWYVLTSPNATGGPYTLATQATGYNFSYSPANDALYYFVIHKVKSPCGEVCYGQNICRNCKNVTACTLCGVIDCSIIDQVLTPTCNSEVVRIIAATNTCNSITAQWQVPSQNPAVVFDVEYKLSTATTWISTTASNTTSTSITISGLLQNTTYDLRIRVKCTANNGSYTTQQFTTGICPLIICEGRISVAINEVACTTALLSIISFNGATFNVQYKLATASTFTTAVPNNTNATSIILTGLLSATLYDYRVTATCRSGGVSIFVGQFTTLPAKACTVIVLEPVPTCQSKADNVKNNEPEGAVTIVPSSFTGAISTSTDVDYYKFQVTAQEVGATINLTTLPADYNLELYEESEVNGGLPIETSQAAGTTDEVIITPLFAGTYYIKVYGVKGAFSAEKCYTLSLRLRTIKIGIELPALTSGTFNSIKNRIIGAINETEPNANNIIKIFPNPTVNKLTINVPNTALQNSLIMYDMMGRNVFSKIITNTMTLLDMEKMNKGLYILKIMNVKGNIVYSEKVIKN